MKKTTMFFLICSIAAVMFVIGCERKVVIENGDVSENDNCFVCHGDNDALIVSAQQEWENSVHGSGANVDYTNRSSCPQCHDHQGFLEFLATGEVNPPYENVTAIHCFTCHAPHSAGNLNLRVDGPYELMNGVVFDHGKANLCVNCHHSRFDVREIVDDWEQGSTRFGAHHGPQGDLIEGTGGYEMAGYTYGHSNHKNVVEDACVGCHMSNPQEHEGYKIGGHSWNMEDPESGYNLFETCAECHDAAGEAEDFDFRANADYDHDGEVEGYQTEVEGLLDSLAVLLVAEGAIDSSHRPIEQVFADANVAGAMHNFGIVEEDRSHGIHNFRYITSLLQNSIDYLD
ncbi:MAG: hypothetical protein JSU85_13245 [Candidatus Zixiibacteriota bacterium]|nr:MAG: hypothetical protein JSU85_13245 [candidate division Zixibacteria bacterium]